MAHNPNAQSKYLIAITHVGGKQVKLRPGGNGERDLVDTLTREITNKLLSNPHYVEMLAGLHTMTVDAVKLEQFIQSVKDKRVGVFSTKQKVGDSVREVALNEVPIPTMLTSKTDPEVIRAFLRETIEEALEDHLYSLKTEILP